MTWPFGDLRMFGYRVIYLDPPWRFENWSEEGEDRNALGHYDCLTEQQLAALPIGHLAHPDGCAMFCWVTMPMLEVALRCINRWGFAYSTIAFTWAKRTRLDTGWHMGLGYTTRGNAEICILAFSGKLGRPKDRGVRSLIVEPLREHSRKPDRVRADIERLYDGPYLEMFARTEHPGWTSWGNQTDKFTG
jgi:N6-adenosine-specific RNA methylase IME4